MNSLAVINFIIQSVFTVVLIVSMAAIGRAAYYIGTYVKLVVEVFEEEKR